VTAPLVATAAVALATATLPGTAHADEDDPPPCSSGQVVISASPTLAAVTHRAVPLTFALAHGAEICTLTGYPGVNSGAGGPLIHAERTPRGYMGGLPRDVETPPTVTITASRQGHSVVEGMAADADGNPCPAYTDLEVTAPDTTDTATVAADINTCQLQVHPVTGG
jgi:Protein of unknown function (DUF4232)